VVRLAAQGRPNREIAQELFITVKTVKDHLTAAYRKLGIRSRSQLGDVLLRDASTAPAPQRRPVSDDIKK
jgi:DNA-binding NarL/FixJ family response regulator